MSFLYGLAKPFLDVLEAEVAHDLTLRGLRLTGGWSNNPEPRGKPVEIAGLTFPNRVGLAAGFDKNAVAVQGLSRLGFGFIEVGGITPERQVGNPKPRIFRLKDDRAVINRMGFNNDGVEEVSTRLTAASRKGPVVVGANLGINRTTALDGAAGDYIKCMGLLYGKVDYFTVNISSPNTPRLRSLEKPARAEALLRDLVAESQRLNELHEKAVPLFVKISPDHNAEHLRELVLAIASAGCDGIIATNTTVDRTGLTDSLAQESGGLSGRPLFNKSLHVVETIRELLGAAFPIVGVGGISSADDARRMRDAGADLIQVYTALVYRGPQLLRELVDAVD